MTSAEARAAIDRSLWFNSQDSDKRAHGRRWRYKLGCRCKECVAANRLHSQMYRALARAEFREGLRINVRHGTVYTYSYCGCRCLLCVEENSRSAVLRMRRWREGVRLRRTRRTPNARSTAAWTPEKRAAHAEKMRRIVTQIPVHTVRGPAGRFRVAETASL